MSSRGLLAPIDVGGLLAYRQQQGLLGPQLRAQTPDLRTRIGNWIYDTAGALGLPANRMREEGQMVVDFVPVVGDAVGMDDARRSFDAGNYGQAAAQGAASAVGLIPGGGDLAAGAAKAIFGGIMAKTADLGALEVAQRMAASGAPREDIWRETGWFQGVDGKWRFEIDDSASKVNHTQVALGGASPDTDNPLPNVMPHDALYEAYPDMERIGVSARMDVGDIEGTYYPPRTVGTKRVVEGMAAKAPTRHRLREVLLHEAQHGVQQREGFAPGASPQQFAGTAPEIVKEVDDEAKRLFAQVAKVNPNLDWYDVPEETRAIFRKRARDQLYVRTAGEVEADNVMLRRDMSASDRRAIPPWVTQNFPDELQIIRDR